jgi:hypothetical protein
MMFPRFILACIVSCGIVSPICAFAQINISALTAIGFTALDNSSEINTMHRNDDPFNPLRVSVFMDSKITPDIGVYLEFLWDSGNPPNGVKTKPRINGAYAVMSPFKTDALNFKFGLIPLPFGAWQTRTYDDRNPLVGIPLFQHYITSLSGDKLAATTDDLKESRDEEYGYLTVAYDACWPYGLEAFGFLSKYEYSFSVTKEAMSNPNSFSNDGVQMIGRFGARPLPGLRLGISGEYGSYLSEGAAGLPVGAALESVHQKAVGIDFAYSFAHTSFFSEFVRNRFENPNLSKDIGCSSWYVEAKQVLSPGFYAAARLDWMLFDDFKDSTGHSFHWDYNINRVESGIGYYFSRNALLKLVWQHNVIEQQENVDLLNMKCVFKL